MEYICFQRQSQRISLKQTVLKEKLKNIELNPSDKKNDSRWKHGNIGENKEQYKGKNIWRFKQMLTV